MPKQTTRIDSESQSQPPAPDSSSAGRSNQGAPDPDRIARRAYERFQMRGGEHGRDQEDWLEAERDLRNDQE